MRLGQFRHTSPDREDLRVGDSCESCDAQLKYATAGAACPWCGSTVRRRPKRKGQPVGDVYDVRPRAAEDSPEDGA